VLVFSGRVGGVAGSAPLGRGSVAQPIVDLTNLVDLANLIDFGVLRVFS